MFSMSWVDNIPDPVIVHVSENTLTDVCSEPEVKAKLKKLKFNKAAGSDRFLLKGLDYPKSSNFSIMLKMKLYVCRNLCENFRQYRTKNEEVIAYTS